MASVFLTHSVFQRKLEVCMQIEKILIFTAWGAGREASAGRVKLGRTLYP